MSLQVGRITINSPQGWDSDTEGTDYREVVDGYLRGATLADTKLLRKELLGQVGNVVVVSWNSHSDFDGFAIMRSVRTTALREDAALQDPGYIRVTLEFDRVGDFSQTELQSLLMVADIDNDHTTTGIPAHAPSVGAKAYNAGEGTPAVIQRTTTEGDIDVVVDIDPDVDPTWSVDPVDYYKGAVTFTAEDELRAGLEMPMDPTDWVLGNGLVEVRPSAFQGATDGEWEVRFYDGTAWGSWIDFEIRWAGTNKVPTWDYVTLIANRPEVCAVRLVRDAVTAPFDTPHRHQLDLTLRRGMRFMSGLYQFSGVAQQHQVGRATTAAATRNAGASFISFDTLVSGDRVLLGCPKSFTEDTTNGRVQLNTAARQLPFFIGAAVDNAANGTDNGPSDIAQQYIGSVDEFVRAVRR